LGWPKEIFNEWQQRMGGCNRFVMVIFNQSKYEFKGVFCRRPKITITLQWWTLSAISLLNP
jgi:hypothetical protein